MKIKLLKKKKGEFVMNMQEEFELIIKEMDMNVYNFTDIFMYKEKLKNIQENLDDTNIYEANDMVTFEILFLSYKIKDGELIPLISTDNSSFPDYSLFNEKCIIYLEDRFEKTQNYLLKSLYSLILYNYFEIKKEKKISYLHSFVDSSLNIIPMIKSKEEISSLDYGTMKMSLISAFKKGISFNYNELIVKERIIDFIYDESIEKSYIKKGLIEFMLDNKKIYKGDDFRGMDDYCWSLYLKEEYTLNKIDFLLLGQRIDNKIQCKNYDWNEEIAKCYEKLVEENENFIVKADFCIDAINYYRKSGNKDKELDLLNQLEFFNNNMELGFIEISIDSKPLERYIDIDLSKKIFFNSTEMIDYLIYSEERLLINRLNKNRKIFDKQLESSPLLNFASRKILNSNKNIRKRISSINSEEEKIMDINESVYIMSLEVINKTYLDRLFIFAYRNKILSYENIVGYLENILDFNIINENNMINYLNPLIKEYFNQLNIYLNGETKEPLFIMFIDSICSKIEYLLKHICSINGISIINVQQDGLTSTVSLKTIFDNEDFKNLINESDYNFLKYVLIEPGLNLRNKSAHGLDLSIYNFSNANLLFLCFFRILKYL